jgi:PAS domain S-box-containing protein
MSQKPTYEELEQRVRELEQVVSDHKKKEKELAVHPDSLGLYEIIVSSVAEPMAAINVNYEFQFVNSAYEVFWDIKKKDIVGKRVPDIMGVDKFNEVVKTKVDQCLSGETVKYSAWFQSPVKGRRYMQLNYYPYKAENGEIVGLINIAYDISDYKEATNRIQKKEEMLSRTESIAHIGSWEWEIETDTVTWSEELYRIFQLDPGGKAPSWKEHSKLYHPEDFKKLRQAVETAIVDCKPYEIELRAFRKDDETRICVAKGFPETGEGGQVVRLFGLLQDISKPKKLEQILINSEAKWRSYIENAPYGVFIANKEGKYKEVNPTAAVMSGYTEKELLDMKISDIWASESVEDGQKRFQKLKNEGHVTSDFVFMHKNGQKRVWSISAVQIDEDNFIGFTEDITNRKKVEDTLIKRKNYIETLNNALSDTIFTVRLPEREIEYVNKSVKKLFGYTPEDCIGQNTSMFYAKKEGYLDFKRKLQQAINEGKKILYSEQSLKKKNGEIFPAEISTTFLRHKDDELKVISIIRDITERKRYENELMKSEAHLEEAQRIAHVGSWDWIAATDTPTWSRELCRILEVDSEKPAPSMADQDRLYTPDSMARMRTSAERAMQTGEPYEIELEHVRDDGSSLWLLARGERWYDEEGEVIGLRGTALDITERKQNEKEKLRLEKQLQKSQKIESIGKLAGGIAHDFNNVLYPIIGFTQLSMEELPKDHPVQDNLIDILDGAKRARDLVKRILLFSRQQDQILKSTSLKPVIEETLKLLRSSIPANINIQSSLYEGDACVMCDETQIHEIVMNLCTNAYHALEDHGGEINVTLTEAGPDVSLNVPDGAYLCLSVADNGTGIPENNLEKIFDPYFTTKEVGKGSGLGLSVVHGIVKNYKGDISVKSEPGKGTVISVFLPVADPESKINESHDKYENLKGTEKILFIDDEKSIVKLCTRTLERQGYHLTGEQDSMGALMRIKNDPDKFDLIITDMAMPKMDGLQLAKKTYEINPDIPVLICSGFSEKLDKTANDLSPNIKAKLDKPLQVQELIKKVREILDQNRGN